MKRILFTSLNDHVPWGGSEELWSKTALNLSNSYDVSVLVKKWKNEANQIDELRNNGVYVFYKKEEKSIPNSFINKLKRKVKQRLKKEINNFDYTVFNHVFISVGDHLDRKLINLTKHLYSKTIKYSIIVQLATDLRNIDDQDSIELLNSYKNAERVFFLSDDNIFKIEMTLANVLYNKDRINNPFNYCQDYTPINNNNFSLACVAAFTCFHKSQDLLISVLSQDKWKNRNINLNLYGNGINKCQLKRLIDRFQMHDKISIKGFVNNKSEIWKNNICCILPSRMEGQSLAMLEAMSHGRMIIATNVGDAGRLVKNGETGFIIEAATYKHIDHSLEEAWSKKDKWVQFGENSRVHLYNIIDVDPVIEFSNKIKDLV